ncbi:MAG: PQQ-dependent sugar dehydrogenase [Thermoanaerobaculia bacterium]
MKFATVVLSLSLVAFAAAGAPLPGFRIEKLADASGFVTSIAADSSGTLYYTVTGGTIYRLIGIDSVPVASVTTVARGNSGLLGMALIDDDTAAIHYTTPNQTHDVVSLIDLRSGTERVIHRFATDIDLPERGSSTEHHGGNPTVAPDGTIFVGIGDYGSSQLATFEAWNAGKIFQLSPDGAVVRYATGLRNPFDLAFDAERNRVIVSDNGPVGGDELHIVQQGANCGWPYTFGTNATVLGTVAPDFVFDRTVAPTGMTLLSGANPMLRSGLLLGAFVTKSLYYFPDLDARPIPKPLVLVERDAGVIIDVTEDAHGNIFVASGSAIYRLRTPPRGDCNGDGVVNGADVDALTAELADGVFQPITNAHNGRHPGSFGCDADGDQLLTAADAAELSRILSWRRRAARSGG